MQLHELKPDHKKKKKKRKGRGDTYAGRGLKGQHTRSGRRMMPAIRDIIKKYHKLRGYQFKPKTPKPEIINLKEIDKSFGKGEVVSPQSLLEKGLVARIKGEAPDVKVLGSGNISKELTFEGCDFSASAKEKIQKAGGKIK
ncbi:MAG: 50S ribosomal protein L15 [Candidatus Nealsonbacteria bacterium]|nr:50S ribosomal protein L15 [Candidatus Nealsonbacteria bacterium]